LNRAREHPLEAAKKTLDFAETGAGVFRAVRSGDWEGLFNLGLREAGSPVSVPRASGSFGSVALPPSVAVDRSAFAVGGNMEEFGLPSDPAGKNALAYIIGGVLLLVVLYGVFMKGR
jgi:hypothetical protein